MKKCNRCIHYDIVGGANVLHYICKKKMKYIEFEIMKAMFCKDYKIHVKGFR